MSEYGLTPDTLKHQYSSDIVDKSTTFETHGVSRQVAIDYLNTREGTLFLDKLLEANPEAPLDRIKDRAIGQLNSGRELPRMEIIDEPLAKIVPHGAKMTAYSPYMTKLSHIENAVAAGQDLFDRFSLFARALS